MKTKVKKMKVGKNKSGRRKNGMRKKIVIILLILFFAGNVIAQPINVFVRTTPYTAAEYKEVMSRRAIVCGMIAALSLIAAAQSLDGSAPSILILGFGFGGLAFHFYNQAR